jgi:hypothetical protein
MVANPNQPLGPNFHVFKNYRNVAGLVLPAYYVTYGQGSNNGGTSNAHHFVWDVQIDQPFDAERLVAPADATLDDVSGDWWNSAPQQRRSASNRKPHSK